MDFSKIEINYVFNIESRELELTEITKLPNKANGKIQYCIRNRGLKNFEMPIKYRAENMVFFDIETAPWDVDFHQEEAEEFDSYLKMDTLQLTCFSLVFGEEIKFDSFSLRLMLEEIYKGEKSCILQKENGIAVYSDNPQKNLYAMLKVLTFIQKGRKTEKKIQLCGHNALRFDSHLFNHVDPEFCPKTDTNAEAKEKILEWRMDGRTNKLVVCDTLHMARSFGCASVEKMGKVVGKEKLSYSAHESMEDYTEYCLQDSEIVYEFVKKEINGHGIYDLNPARYARNYFYHKFFDENKNIEVIGTSANINKFEVRAARTEAYFKEIENSYYVDANSLYPTAQTCLDMVVPDEYESKVKNEHGELVPKLTKEGEPIRRLHYSMLVQGSKKRMMMRTKLHQVFRDIKELDSFTPKKLQEIYDLHFSNKFYMLEVKIKGIREDFGSDMQKNRLLFYYPFVLKRLGKTIFRLEKDQTYQIGFYEILFLSFFDYEIEGLWEMKKGKGIFTPYIEELYAQRRKKKELKQPDKFEKLVLNSGGYGIFIIKNRESKKIENSDVYEFFNKTIQGKAWKQNINDYRSKKLSINIFNETTPRYYKAGGKIFEPKFIGENTFSVEESEMKWIESSIPILGLNILSNSRFFMYCFYLNAVFNGSYEIYYTDTDSLFCNKKMYEFIQESGYDGKELGQFKLEYYIDKAFFLAPKAYVTLHREENGKYIVITTLKGTGERFVRQIVMNRKFQSTVAYTKVAFNPTTIQKRSLDASGRYYLNKFSDGDPEKWMKQYEEYMDKVISYYRFAAEENKKNGFDYVKYEDMVKLLSKEKIEVLNKAG